MCWCCLDEHPLAIFSQIQTSDLGFSVRNFKFETRTLNSQSPAGNEGTEKSLEAIL